jgi:hypothetical protein
MPGSYLKDVSLRPGCVVVGMNLLTSSRSGSPPTLNAPVRAVSRALAACKADGHLKIDSSLTAQMTSMVSLHMVSLPSVLLMCHTVQRYSTLLVVVVNRYIP